jgi:hypothetical protein
MLTYYITNFQEGYCIFGKDMEDRLEIWKEAPSKRVMKQEAGKLAD